MVYDYVITLKHRNYATIDAISQLMYVFALGAFTYFTFAFPASKLYFLAVNFLIIINWIFCIIKRQKTGYTLFRLGLFFAVFGWLGSPGSRFILAILYAIAGLLEKQVKFPEEIGFSSTGVVVNTFPKKKFSWADIANVVLKDNLLTVDFKNNKLIQKEINEGVSITTEKEFNEFCALQLKNIEG